MRLCSTWGVNSKSKPLGTGARARRQEGRPGLPAPRGCSGPGPPSGLLAPSPSPAPREGAGYQPGHGPNREESPVLGRGMVSSHCHWGLVTLLRRLELRSQDRTGSPPPTGDVTLSRSLGSSQLPFLSVKPAGAQVSSRGCSSWPLRCWYLTSPSLPTSPAKWGAALGGPGPPSHPSEARLSARPSWE